MEKCSIARQCCFSFLQLYGRYKYGRYYYMSKVHWRKVFRGLEQWRKKERIGASDFEVDTVTHAIATMLRDKGVDYRFTDEEIEQLRQMHTPPTKRKIQAHIGQVRRRVKGLVEKHLIE